MYILKKVTYAGIIGYLKYDGWHLFNKDQPLDLNGCILFTKREVALNPPGVDQDYQHWGCYTPIKKEHDEPRRTD